MVVIKMINPIVEIIRKRRLDLEISMNELAEKAGISRQMIHNWENRGDLPMTDSFLKVCNVLGLEIRDFSTVYNKTIK